jgi:hypothetical protein
VLGESLTIQWDGVDQIELPITVFIDGADGSEVIAREALTTETPWPESAPVSELDGGLAQAVSVTGDAGADGSVTTASNNTWSAHQAGGGNET